MDLREAVEYIRNDEAYVAAQKAADDLDILRQAALAALESLQELYTKQQRLSHPDTRFDLPEYKRARAAQEALGRALGLIAEDEEITSQEK